MGQGHFTNEELPGTLRAIRILFHVRFVMAMAEVQCLRKEERQDPQGEPFCAGVDWIKAVGAEVWVTLLYLERERSPKESEQVSS